MIWFFHVSRGPELLLMIWRKEEDGSEVGRDSVELF